MTPVTQTLLRRGEWADAATSVTLDHDERFLRRKRLTAADGTSFLVDFPRATSLEAGDALDVDGRLVEIIAAREPVLIVTGENLARLAWHIGNRHTPCQIGPDHLVIRNDPVIAHMLTHVGGETTPAEMPFTPEGGAYGHGRTHAHEHGNSAHNHEH